MSLHVYPWMVLIALSWAAMGRSKQESGWRARFWTAAAVVASVGAFAGIVDPGLVVFTP